MASTVYYFLLGSAPDLAFLELQSVLNRYQESSPERLDTHLARASLAQISSSNLLDTCGGVVKVLENIGEGTGAILADLKDHPVGAFALTALDPGIDTLALSREVKRQAVQAGLSGRYRQFPSVFTSTGNLSHTQEYLLLDDAANPTVLKTVAIQDIDRWTQKDYSRPQVSPRQGMLPPKVSRMLVNCALPAPIAAATTVYDPFCGVGTVLAEALDLGTSVVGSDISPQAVEQTRQNLEWLKATFSRNGAVTLFTANILDPHSPPLPSGLSAVVFEGYLGPPHPEASRLDNYVRGLEKFYLGAMKRLAATLLPGGYLVGAVPAFVEGNNVKILKRLIDSCEKLGYTQAAEPVWYYRPQAKVRRQILIWQKK